MNRPQTQGFPRAGKLSEVSVLELPSFALSLLLVNSSWFPRNAEMPSQWAPVLREAHHSFQGWRSHSPPFTGLPILHRGAPALNAESLQPNPIHAQLSEPNLPWFACNGFHSWDTLLCLLLAEDPTSFLSMSPSFQKAKMRQAFPCGCLAISPLDL